MITLNGLTPRQVDICNQIWAFDSLEKVNAYVILVGAEAKAMRDLMVATVLDERMDVAPEVQSYLSKF